MNVELLVSLVSEHKELYEKFVWFWQACKYLLSSSEWQASVRSVKLRSATLCTGVFLFYIKHHLMSGNEFACSLGSSSAKIAWVWTQKTRWKTLANNARRYSSRCVRALRSAMKAYGVPCGGGGLVCLVCSVLFKLRGRSKRLQGVTDRGRVWQNIFTSSKNHIHRLIHYHFCHRTYWTPLNPSVINVLANNSDHFFIVCGNA